MRIENELLAAAIERRNAGQLDQAEALYRQAIACQPEYAEAHLELGIFYHAQGRNEATVEAYRTAIRLGWNEPEVFYWLSLILTQLGELHAAKEACEQALRLHPDYLDAVNNLANVCIALGELNAGVEQYRRAIGLEPNFRDAHHNLGNAFYVLGDYDAARQSFQKAVAIDPEAIESLGMLMHLNQECCYWDGMLTAATKIIESLEREYVDTIPPAINPMMVFGLPIPTTSAQQARSSQNWVRRMCPPSQKSIALTSPGRSPSIRSRDDVQSSQARSKIRIGYLSSDFREHPVSYLIPELFEEHDRSRFEIFGYSTGMDDQSSIRQRLVKAFDRFHDLASCSFPNSAQQIAADRIDILVDLQGHTRDARTQILALKPAPVQVNYLGFPGTMGAVYMDYILVDDYVVPTNQQGFYSEKLISLPGCFMVNDSRREISSHTPDRRELGLPDDGFVFCAFQSNYKLTREMFECWMKLLSKVPKSVLWMRGGNAVSTANLRNEASRLGVDPSRLIFAEYVAMSDHLARHRQADLFLDTFPYNQHSTASDALRMGLPLVTIAGQTFASRVAGSLLSTLELPELIARDFDEYKEKAIAFASDPGWNARIRERLRTSVASSSLYDGKAFARKIEGAFLKM